MTASPSSESVPRWRLILGRIPTAVVVAASAVFAVLVLILPILPGERTVSLRVGDVSPQDVLAPQAVTYVSRILTQQARDEAAAQVAPVYNPPDPLIARQQAETLRTVFAYITNVRANPYASLEEKLSDLQELSKVNLPTDTATRILQLSDPEWEMVQQESQAVLERIMRQPIGPDQLQATLNSIPNYVSLAFPENQVSLVTDLLRNLIVPNSLYNESETQSRRDLAAANVTPVTRSFVAGQVVIPRGKLVAADDLEAVFMLGLTTESLNLRVAASMILAVVLATVLLSMFVFQFHREITRGLRPVLLLALILLSFLTVGRIMVPGHTVLPFLFPVSAMGMLIACVYGRRLGILTAMLLCIFTGLMGGNSLEIALFGGMSSLSAVLVLGKGEKPMRFLLAGTAAGVTGSLIVLIIRLSLPASDLIGILTLIAASLVNGLLSASLSLGLIFLVGNLFDITTNLQLLDLSRPDHPLLREILLQAPGTYQHSLQVANLAEHAGERIGANPLLLRVGALYHDVGKSAQPKFFVENQGPEGNPHDRLDPEASARLIIQHTRDGLHLARKHHLPTRVRDLIVEHHGTLRTNFQYGLALNAAGGNPDKVNEAKFHYPGPRPHTKEAAILMLADGVEAKFRAVGPATAEEIETLVREVVDDRLAQRQFDQTDLTMHDVEIIREAFADALQGRVHSRLRYPEDEKKQPGKTDPNSR
jgi:putative nucleotidyltransferase with HDIG domain